MPNTVKDQVREKLVELSDIQVLQREMECVKRKSATNCSDCLNCDLLMTDERILTAYKNAIDALQNSHGVTVQGDKDINVPTKWISVKDRLPFGIEEYYQQYGEYPEFNVMIEGGRIPTTLFFDGEGWFDTANEYYKVTHWLPLPPAPGVCNV